MKEKHKLLGAARAFNFGNPTQEIQQYAKFANDLHLWIHSSKQEIKGLPKKRYIVSGVTDAFNQLYGLYNKIGVFEGEYYYHYNVLGPERVTTDLREADCIVISHPFSGDGESSHDRLREANSYGVPIFVDCALFGICKNIDFDFKPYKNIRSVCFSLSKTFGTGLRRVGLLYTKDKFPCSVYNEWQYPLIAGADHHYQLIHTIGPDDLPAKYEQKQLRVCRRLGLKPSSTVIFGTSKAEKYNAFKRGDTNRMCITRYLEEDDEE